MLRQPLLLIERLFHARVKHCTVPRVIDTRQVNAHMRRVSLSGMGLQSFDTPENLHVKLLLPPTGARRDTWLCARWDGQAALPAIARILRAMPGHLLGEVADVQEQQQLTVREGMQLKWLHRDGAAPGTTSLLHDMVCGVTISRAGRRDFVWVEAEFSAVQAIRSRLRKEKQRIISYRRRRAADAK